MAPLIGNFTLWLSLFASIYQFAINNKEIKKTTLKNNRLIVNSLFLLILISFLSLTYSHIISDFSVINVFENSHTTKPLVYKISGVWGNHEGSMLLWILVLSIINLLIFKLNNNKNLSFISRTLKVQSLIIIGFLIFVIFTSNPFDRMHNVPLNGLGFNPILQDPALAIHPPLLYIGYVGLSAAYSFSIAALISNSNERINWDIYMKPFVVLAWTFLSIGIIFGSIWAYYELGWGGWWFWDPVENAALMPWLLSTGLLHSLIASEKKKSLQSWVLLLAILSFLLSVIGTFLVRSGILTSVHTFALDPSRGIFILILISLLGSYSLILYVLKSKNFLQKNYFPLFSKENSILINNIIMAIVCASVFLGTTYPLFIEIFTKNRISVGEPYFNLTIIPILIPAILIMGIGPMLSWIKTDMKKVIKKTIPSIIMIILAIIIYLFIFGSNNFLGLVGICLSLWIIINVLIIFFQKIFEKNRVINKNSYGMIIAHFGVGLLILGITGSSVWQKEKITRMQINDKTYINQYNIVFDKLKELKGPNYLALQGVFEVYDSDNKLITKLKPENRFYPVTKNSTTEVSIHTNLLRDLYIVLGEGNLDKGWIVRIYYNPLVIWIWIGAFIIFIGGIVTLKQNLKRAKL